MEPASRKMSTVDGIGKLEKGGVETKMELKFLKRMSEVLTWLGGERVVSEDEIKFTDYFL